MGKMKPSGKKLNSFWGLLPYRRQGEDILKRALWRGNKKRGREEVRGWSWEPDGGNLLPYEVTPSNSPNPQSLASPYQKSQERGENEGESQKEE